MVLALFVVACQPAADVGLGDGELTSARVLVDGTPEAAGVLAMLNARTTTMTVLDVDAGLDKRAAKNLIAHRDGGSGAADDNNFDSIDEVDAVAYVGDAALSALLAYATDEGWIPVDDDYYGTIETVSFTKAEAAGVVALANTLTFTQLDVDVGLDSRAATGIVAGRPYTTLEAVAAVPYVGAGALNDLKAAVGAPTVFGTDAAVGALTPAVDGLWFSSEGDFPMVPFAVHAPTSTALTSVNVKTVVGASYVARPDRDPLAARSVEASSVAWVFDSRTVAQDWWDDTQRADQPRWQAVRDVFEQHLSNVTVWRFGRRDSSGQLVGDIDVLVVGVSADGDLVGFWTVSIET